MSHNGFDVDRKLAGILSGVDVILTGHTHDAVPVALEVNGTLIMASGSHGKFLGRIDLEVANGKVTGYSSSLIPVFADVIQPDQEMSSKIAEFRDPHKAELERVLALTGSLLYRRGNFNGTWDDLICQGIIEERDTQISLSPGFRWGTTLLPGQDITIDDLYTETSMSYPLPPPLPSRLQAAPARAPVGRAGGLAGGRALFRTGGGCAALSCRLAELPAIFAYRDAERHRLGRPGYGLPKRGWKLDASRLTGRRYERPQLSSIGIRPDCR